MQERGRRKEGDKGVGSEGGPRGGKIVGKEEMAAKLTTRFQQCIFEHPRNNEKSISLSNIVIYILTH